MTETDGKVRKVLFNEVSLAIAAVGLISSVIFWVVNPQHDLQLKIVELESRVENNRTVQAELEKIKNNDLHEIQLRMDRMEERQIEQLKATARIEALLR